MPKFEGAALAREWSTRLGLAQTPLLDPARDPEGQHFALFDGIEGSFALSTAKVEPTQGLDWTWSSQLANHVEVGDDTVLVRQVDPNAQVLQFERGAVGEHLDRFFETIVAKRVAPAITVVDHIVGCFRSHRHVTANAGLTLEEGLSSFLALLDDEILDRGHSANWEARLPDGHGNRLREELSYSQLTGRNADLALTMRHAAGMVFQRDTRGTFDRAPSATAFWASAGTAALNSQPARRLLYSAGPSENTGRYRSKAAPSLAGHSRL